MIKIDGSEGEGGGQVLRTALALSLVTGTPFRIENIRAKRKRPGLLRQHLTAVQAAAAIGRAQVEGDALASASLTFTPGAVRPGDYRFAVGTAGSAMLVLQTILPPLMVAAGPSTVIVDGGTHNLAAPPFEFIERAFLPIVNTLGPHIEVELKQYGFYPAGGGQVVARIEPASAMKPLALLERGEITRRQIRALVANLPRHIGEREARTAMRLLNWTVDWTDVEELRGVSGPGNAVLIEIASEHVTEIHTAFGESGVAAEAVANHAAQAARRYLAAGVPVGCNLADQLLTVMAIGAGGTFRTLSPTQHSKTNADIIHLFTGKRTTMTEESRDVVCVEMAR
jgi:RNA 3'-terminal phosphate cyclase (ATP)